MVAAVTAMLTVVGVAEAGGLNYRDWRNADFTFVPEKSTASMSVYEHYIYTPVSSTPTFNFVTDVRVVQWILYRNGVGPSELCGDYYERRNDNVPTNQEGWRVGLV